MVAPLRIGFFGTPAFALATLDALHRSTHDVVVVMTQPDRPRGRGQKLTDGPVKAFAVAEGIPVLQPERLKDETLLAELSAFRLDLVVVAAYGRIIPRAMLALPRLGMINVHASLLPRWRGAAPIHRAILAGDAETGVTIMRVVFELDAGPMLSVVRTPIGADDTSGELETRLAALGATLLVDTVDRLATGPVSETPQPEAGVTYAHRLERADSHVDWKRPARVIHNQIRGLQPWPAVVTLFKGRRLSLLGSVVDARSHDAVTPGTVIDVTAEDFVVATGTGAVRVTRVQMEGKSPLTVRQFLSGYPVVIGDRLDPLPAPPSPGDHA